MRLLACLLLLSVAAGGALPEQEAAAVFREANDLFRQANEKSAVDPREAYDLYRRSALRYQRLIEEGGIENGRLHYNLGNAYFRMDDLGRAILSYRRAERLLPADRDVMQNLASARARRLDSFELETSERALRTLLFWHFDLSFPLRRLLLALFSGAFWAVAAWAVWHGRGTPRGALVATGLLAAAMAASLAAEAFGTASSDVGVVTAPQTVARKGDGETYEPAFTEPLHAGAEFRLRERRDGWYRGELPDGRAFWLPARDAELVGR
jgi:tetratricopeptide (TPR) repeat protein